MTSAPTRTHPWLALFFGFGLSMCILTIGLLCFPGTPLDAVWCLNPNAHAAFQSIGGWSISIMLVVGTACLIATIGLWRGACWGTRAAIIILVANMIGDLSNALLKADFRTLIGLPIAAAMIVYLARSEKLCAPSKCG
ncbi:MAG TPA: hypothetical protein VLK27_10595 [Chthoniobacterales bacterium]|nr:hypothetical protein [Chthoniobacterales bacterium]